MTELDWGESRIRQLRSRVDDLSVTLGAIADLADEMRRDVADDRSWDDDLGAEYVERLSALLDSTVVSRAFDPGTPASLGNRRKC